jgi:RNA polymerase sigma factor (sigma-70 family)
MRTGGDVLQGEEAPASGRHPRRRRPSSAEVAGRYHGRVEAEELYGPGTIALRQAVLAYRAERHPCFTDYAKHHVHGRMIDAVAKEHFSLGVRVELAMERGYEYFCAHLPERDPFAAGDDPPLDDANQACSDVLTAAIVGGFEAIKAGGEDAAVDRLALRNAVAKLPEHERRVLSLLYEQGMTPDEVATEVRVHPNTAHNLHTSALRKLRKALTS